MLTKLGIKRVINTRCRRDDVMKPISYYKSEALINIEVGRFINIEFYEDSNLRLYLGRYPDRTYIFILFEGEMPVSKIISTRPCKWKFSDYNFTDRFVRMDRNAFIKMVYNIIKLNLDDILISINTRGLLLESERKN